MATGYSPLKITGNETGLVQDREEFLLPDDAYPQLINAYVYREKLKRKKGCQSLGRLQRTISGAALGNMIASGGGSTFSYNLITGLSLGSTASIAPGTINVTACGFPWVEPSPQTGILINPDGVPDSSINYSTGDLVLNENAAFIGCAVVITFDYYPGLPVMGILVEENTNSSFNTTIFFDQKYAYTYNGTTNQFQEFIPGVTWNAWGASVYGSDFFWGTNYWTSSTLIPGSAIPFFSTSGNKIFWTTNNTGSQGANADPIRITDGTSWVDFSPPNFGQINATDYLVQCLSMLPFRNRMLAFNTWEGPTYASAVNYSNRIRWSTIGNPFIVYAAGPPATGSWRDDLRGQGGYLDIPTSEDIVGVGFVRDNLVVYCERSTWQLRYTGRSIAPFQIERVNVENGSETPYGLVQFDKSIMTIGDKGIINCDSYKAERFDIKIPSFVFDIQAANSGSYRIQGIRDFVNRLVYWTIPLLDNYDPRVSSANWVYPNIRLLYNYENDSWAIFDDTFTALGNFQPQSSRTWLNTKIPWIKCNFSWLSSRTLGSPSIVGGNQQGFISYLDQITTNDPTLGISNIQGQTTTPTVIECTNHNLRNGTVIQISGIIGTPYSSLNNGIFSIILGDQIGANTKDKFRLTKYNPSDQSFSTPQLDVPGDPYIGGGVVAIRDNFSIKSKKFNFLDEGQSIQLGYIDILTAATEEENPGAFSMNIYLDYDDNEPSNTLPQNQSNFYATTATTDTFFNSVIPTTKSDLNGIGGSKFWQRVICPTRANFLTIEYTFSNAQMAGTEQQQDVQIDAQVLWIRRAGRMTQI